MKIVELACIPPGDVGHSCPLRMGRCHRIAPVFIAALTAICCTSGRQGRTVDGAILPQEMVCRQLRRSHHNPTRARTFRTGNSRKYDGSRIMLAKARRVINAWYQRQTSLAQGYGMEGTHLLNTELELLARVTRCLTDKANLKRYFWRANLDYHYIAIWNGQLKTSRKLNVTK